MYLEKFRLDKKTAVITGGSRGIGKAIAIAFAEAGADVVVAGRKLPQLEETAREVEALGARCLPVSAHMGKMEELENLIGAALKEFKKVDILVNNVAINPKFGPVEDTDEALFDKMIDVNLKAYLFLSKMAMGSMEKEGGGSIVNISSIEGFSPSYGTGLYNVTKASVIMLTKVLALEWASKKIRVNSIAPGLIKTHFSEFLWSNEDPLKYFMERCPMKRAGEPEEIASLALLLASDASSYTTGAVFTADGGFLI
jgi:dehydrogenase/reductase SDR family protein 4